MVRILGNSLERVRIRDLGDVIYYKQEKDYTDQEYESSKDLKKEVKKGNLTILERHKTPRSSAERGGNGSVSIKQNAPKVDLEDIKTAVREVLPQEQGMSLKGLIPTLVDSLRQEFSSIVGSRGPSGPSPEVPSAKTTEFRDPSFIPSIDTSGMKSSITVDKREASGGDTASSLEALRKLRKKK